VSESGTAQRFIIWGLGHGRNQPPRRCAACSLSLLSLPAATAGYRIYPCKDDHVAVAALEPHFAAALCAAAGVPPDVFAPATHAAIAAFMAARTRVQLDALAVDQDIPLHTMAA